WVYCISKAKVERVHFGRTGQIFDMRLAREVVGCGGQRTVRTLPQWRACLMKFSLLVWNVIQAANAGAAGVVVVQFPRGDGAVAADTPGDVDHSCRPQVRPGELLLAQIGSGTCRESVWI